MWMYLTLAAGLLVSQTPVRYAVSQGSVRTKFFNNGSIGGPHRVNPWPRLEWPAGSGHEYLYETALLIAGRVKAYNPSTHDSVWIWIVDDGAQDAGDNDFAPVNGYANPNSDTLAVSTNSATWPSEWPVYQTLLGDSVAGLSGGWPGEFWSGRYVVPPEHGQEAFWVMSDSTNMEFVPGNQYGNPYYDPGANLNGLGLKIYGRSYAIRDYDFDALVFDYIIFNVSEKTLDSLIVGVCNDVRVGGPGSDFDDDMYGVDTVLDYLRFYDQDGWGRAADGTRYPAGQFALVFLQTPGNASDNIDNDGDGMVDESPYDGIDNDNDWNAQYDDVGMDGIPNTGDTGEGDGVPTSGEPNFEWRDPDEIDEMQLTSASSAYYGFIFPSNDERVGETLRPGHFSMNPGPGDYLSFGGSGFFSLQPGQWTRFVFAYVFADGRDTASLNRNVRKLIALYRQLLLTGARFQTFDLNLTHPASGEVVSGDYPIEWEPGTAGARIAEMDISDDGGNTFRNLMGNQVVGGSSFSFDTRALDDGSLYKLSLTLVDQYRGLGYDTSGIFIIDNPEQDGAPNAVILPGAIPSTVRGDLSIPILTGEPEGESYNLSLLLSLDDRRSWENLFDTTLSGVLDTLTFHFDSRGYPNTDSAYFALVCTQNGNVDTTFVTNRFSIANHRHYQSGDSAVVHLSGMGDSSVVVAVSANPSNDHTFRLTFASGADGLSYSLYDLHTSQYVFENYPLVGGLESPDFGNMRLLIYTVNDTLPDSTFDTHIAGNSNFYAAVHLSRNGVKIPHDYQIEFHNARIGRAFYGLNFNDTVMVNFTITDVQTGNTIIPIFIDIMHDTLISSPSGEYLIITDTLNGQRVMSWGIVFHGPSSGAVPPSEGDIYYLKILNPFSEADTFLIYASRISGISETEINRGGLIQLSPRNVFSARSARIEFVVNSPANLRVRVFDVAGREQKDIPITVRSPGKVTVNLKGLSPGVYFISIESPGTSPITRKLLIIN